MPFREVDANISFPQLEQEIGRFWLDRGIYEKSLEQRAEAPKFVFFEGPPTANGLPHPGHCLTRAIKDLYPRYRTMRGYFCERKGGWDTHGLPVEVEVCKELGIHAKEEIEAYGVEPFIHKCQQSVWRYMQEWERLTQRLGFWIHLEEAYVTYHQSYVESVWWSLKNLYDRGLLFQGHKIVWWWAQGGTALSAGEVGQGYREVADPSVYVRFPLLDEKGNKTDTSLLVWTTTPWTLPSNHFAAVHPNLEYSTVVDQETGEKLIMASALVETIAGKAKHELTVESTCPGTELLGKRYLPPFDFYYKTLGGKRGKLASGGDDVVGWKVLAADFVTTDSGTGVVHQAPAFGEVDYAVLVAEQERFAPGEGPALINAVGPDGKFTSEVPTYEGRWVKEADRDIIRELKSLGVLYHQEQYLHDYPFCWRAEEDPLIQYPRESWFIRTTAFKDKMLANNQQINWLPDHIREGRMGNFLETNVDWALSRERYWGTPLPIWQCEKTGQGEAIGSYQELLAKPGVSGTEVWEKAKVANPELPDDLCVHKPYIDEITYDSPFAPGARMRRVPEVIDCWYDSGAMPFAQWGYPHAPDSRERFESQFPADFISEAIDQTRGWFYSQLAISTLLFSDEDSQDPDAQPHKLPHPYKTCIVLGLMLADWWESKDGKKVFLTEEDAQAAVGKDHAHRTGKMSKQKRNYREPNEIFDRYGADALRWYFFANQPPWTSIRYSEQSIKDSIPEFLLRLWNVYSFAVIYANIDGFDPGAWLTGEVGELTPDVLAGGKHYRPAAERGELDRWILSELNRMVAAVVERMDAYDNYAAAARITEFVDALSNWYVRRSRERFWSNDKQSVAKLDAYWTLYECLITTSKVIAPFVPFLAESLWQNLVGSVFGSRAVESVHLCRYPEPQADEIDNTLSDQMQLVREIVSLGRSARMGAKLKVRQPLSRVLVVLANNQHQPWLEAHAGLIREELNVKEVEFASRADEYITYTVLPNLPRLGPRLGKQVPQVRKALEAVNPAELLQTLENEGSVTLDLGGTPVTLDSEDVQVRLQAKEGWAAAQGVQSVVVLATELTDELIAEGTARDLVRGIQDLRKDRGCQFTDRIELAMVTTATDLAAVIQSFQEFIQTETLAVSLTVLDKLPDDAAEWDIQREMKVSGSEVTILLRVAK